MMKRSLWNLGVRRSAFENRSSGSSSIHGWRMPSTANSPWTKHSLALGGNLAPSSQARNFSWSSLNPFAKKTPPSQPIEEAMPEIFTAPPEEIDDYVRPEKTMFENVEDWYDYLWNTFSPVDFVGDVLIGIHAGTSALALFGPMSWPAVLFMWGMIVRACTLPIGLYTSRNANRLVKIQKQLGEITQAKTKAKQDKNISSKDKTIIKDGLNRKKKAIEKSVGAANWKTGLLMVNTPALVTSFMAIRELCSFEVTLEKEGFGHIPDLTQTDPYLLLPSACMSLFVLNAEYSQAVNATSGRSSTRMYMKWGIRFFGTVGVFAFFQYQPVAVFFYWMGSSTISLLQPFLLSNDKFRQMFKYPPRTEAQKESENEVLLARLFMKLGLKEGYKGKSGREFEAAAAASAASSSSTTGEESTAKNVQSMLETLDDQRTGEGRAVESIRDYEILDDDDEVGERALKSGAKVKDATK